MNRFWKGETSNRTPADAEPGYTLLRLDRIIADLAAMHGDEWMREQVAAALLRRHPTWAQVIDHERKSL